MVDADLQGDAVLEQGLLDGASMVRPSAMTSPVAFIWVPRLRSARANLSNGQRGILATT